MGKQLADAVWHLKQSLYIQDKFFNVFKRSSGKVCSVNLQFVILLKFSINKVRSRVCELVHCAGTFQDMRNGSGMLKLKYFELHMHHMECTFL